jgi:hypothetical protein
MKFNNVLTVAIDPTLMDQFLHLAPSWYSEDLQATVMIHHSPILHVSGTEVVKNFDMVISPDHPETQKGPHGHLWSDFLSAPQLVQLARPSKLSQAARVNAIAERLKFKGFRSVGSYYSSVGRRDRTYSLSAPLPEKVVVKARDGARGIGQLLVDTTKVPLGVLLPRLAKKEYMSEQAILENFPSIILGTGAAANDGESINLLAGELVVQEYIPNVTGEYRLLVHPGGSIYALRRKLKKGTGYTQATGVTEDFREDRMTHLDEVDFFGDEDDGGANIVDGPTAKEIAGDIHTLVQALGFEYGSIDLFLTNNKRGWGLFEYCNQFGTAAYHPTEMADFHRSAIEAWLKRVVKGGFAHRLSRYHDTIEDPQPVASERTT